MSTLATLPPTVREAIIANLDLLHLRLVTARTAVSGAVFAMRNDRQAQAVGLLLDFEPMLPEIDALTRLVLMLQRSDRTTSTLDEVQS